MDFVADGISYLGELRDFALQRLPCMLDPGEQLFSYRSTLEAGGWPWRYNAPGGAVAEVYPLFSVHQDGMAPMALAQLESLNAGAYLSSVCKSILWLDGRNEINRPVFDETRDIVWRGIRRKGPLALVSQLNKALSLINVQSHTFTDRAAPVLEFIREARSYELGWILCAAAAVDDAYTTHRTGSVRSHADET